MTLKTTPLSVSIAVYLKIAQERAECVSSSPHKIPLGLIEHKLLDFVAGIFGREQDERYCLTSSPIKWELERPQYMKCGVSQCPCLLVIIPVELLLGHYRGLISQNSACRENEWNSLLSPSASVPGEPKTFGLSAGLLHSLCRLGQRDGKRLFIHIIVSQMS